MLLEEAYSGTLAHHLARLSALVYEPFPLIAQHLGDRLHSWHTHDGTEAMIVDDMEYVSVVFRGTQVSERFSVEDIMSNLRLGKVDWPAGGRAHRGYAEACLDVSADVWAALQQFRDGTGWRRPVFYTGHSLGGTLATLMATLPPSPTATYTFGAPRAGNAAVHQGRTSPLYRLVHGNDFAPHVPPALWGYRHPSKPIRIGAEEWRGFPSIAAHNVRHYVESTGPGRPVNERADKTVVPVNQNHDSGVQQESMP